MGPSVSVSCQFCFLPVLGYQRLPSGEGHNQASWTTSDLHSPSQSMSLFYAFTLLKPQKKCPGTQGETTTRRAVLAGLRLC